MRATCRGAQPTANRGVCWCEVMLQQTPVTRVEPVWRAWLTRWPEPADLAAADPGEAIRGWGRLDTPGVLSGCTRRRTRSSNGYGGAVPTSYHELRPPGGRGLHGGSNGGVRVRAPSAWCSTPTFGVPRAVGGTARPSPTTTAAERRRAESLMPADAATAVTRGRRHGVGRAGLHRPVATLRRVPTGHHLRLAGQPAHQPQ